jgi:hypothetical protein
MIQPGVAATPENAQYFHAAYIWAALLYGGYAIVLRNRVRHVRDRLRALRSSNTSR